MQIDGAIIKEQGITFAIVVVQPSAIQTSMQADQVRKSLQAIQDFQGLPLILAAQDGYGQFSYQGRRDIVDFLAGIDAARIPWKRYTTY
jgi:hypothetical protein